MDGNTLILLVMSSVLLFDLTNGQCMFPTDLIGQWVSSSDGIWTISSTHMLNYRTKSETSGLPVVMGRSTMNFECWENRRDTKYLIRSESFEIFFGVSVSLYTCLDIRQVSSIKLLYYQTTALDQIGSRFTFNDNYTEVCSLESYLPAYNYRFALRSDGQCIFPTELIGTWASDTDGTWTINSTHMLNYRTVSETTGVAVAKGKSTMNFVCWEHRGDTKYMIQSNPYELFNGVFVSLYTCLDIRPQSSVKLIYYQAGSLDVDGFRFTFNDNYTEVCNLAAYSQSGNYRVAFKSDVPCVIPTDLIGTWVSRRDGTWTINSSHILGYKTVSETSGLPVAIGRSTMKFECWENRGDTKYVIRSQPFEIFTGFFVSLYTCLDIRPVSYIKLMYYQVTALDSNGFRFTFNDNYTEVCNLECYAQPSNYRDAFMSGFNDSKNDTCEQEHGICDSMIFYDSNRRLVAMRSSGCKKFCLCVNVPESRAQSETYLWVELSCPPGTLFGASLQPHGCNREGLVQCPSVTGS